MSPQDIRSTLIARTIAVIATDGLDKATTKAIVTGTGINEAYIYRHFSDKEDLFSKAFESLDEELVAKAMRHVSVMYMSEMEYETRCRFFFSAMWKFLLENEESCLAYIQYYYSPYFQKYSVAAHRARFEPLVAKFSDAFQKEANAWMLLNHILTTMLDFARKVFGGAVPDDEDTAEHVFRLVYHSVKPYFKKNREVLVSP